MIYDEIQCGLGRTGEFFAFHHWGNDFTPDVLTAAKPIAAGLPLGVVMCNEKAAAVFAAGMHGSTFGGGALACRAAVEFSVDAARSVAARPATSAAISTSG